LMNKERIIEKISKLNIEPIELMWFYFYKN
jgi:hypothetical protein